MRIKLFNEENLESYQKFLLQQTSPQFYSSLKYLSLLEDYLSSKLKLYLAYDGAEIVGVLPLMEKEGSLGTVLNSLPYFGSLGGAVTSNSSAEEGLINFYNELVDSDNYAAATIVENPLYTRQSTTEFLKDHLDTRIGQFTYLDGIHSKDALFKLIHSSARRNVRKAFSNSIEVIEDSRDINSLYEMHLANMSDINGKSKELSFFELMVEYMQAGSEFKIYYGLYEGEKIAGLLTFFHNEYVEYFTPVSKLEYRSLQPMAAVLFKVMLESAKNGFRVWNWGGTWQSQDGVYKFKKKWGAEDQIYRYHTKVNNKDIYTKLQDQLEADYTNFYVVPYSELGSKNP